MIQFLLENAASFSSLFGILASIALFIPLTGLTNLARQFQILEALDGEGLTREDIIRLRRQIVGESLSSNNPAWLYLAGLFFGLALVFWVASLIPSV